MFLRVYAASRGRRPMRRTRGRRRAAPRAARRAIVSIKDLLDVAGRADDGGIRSAAGRQPPRPRMRRWCAVSARPAPSSSAKPTWSSSHSRASGSTPITGPLAMRPIRPGFPGGSSSGAGVSVGGGNEPDRDRKRHGRLGPHPGRIERIVGFKPTARRVPLQGAFPLSYTSDSLGPLATTVQDCAATDAVMAGRSRIPSNPSPWRDCASESRAAASLARPSRWWPTPSTRQFGDCPRRGADPRSRHRRSPRRHGPGNRSGVDRVGRGIRDPCRLAVR